MLNEKKELSLEQRELLLEILTNRFEKNRNRHLNLDWNEIELRLMSNPIKMWSLSEMEKTGGEPDVIGFDKETGEYIFCDCSLETPEGRRSICYVMLSFINLCNLKINYPYIVSKLFQ